MLARLTQLGYGVLYALYTLAITIPNIVVRVRRMHDVGKRGWYLLFPIYNIILLVTNGDSGEKTYGGKQKI